MSALTILRAASRDVANERYVEVMEAIDALAELSAAASEMNRLAKGPDGGVSVADKRAIVSRMGAALTRCGVPA